MKQNASDVGVERSIAEEVQDVQRCRNLPRGWSAAMAALTVTAILLAINQIFALGFFVGYTLFESAYLYLVTGAMLSMVFVYFPPTARASRSRVPWYDVGLALLALGLFGYLAVNADRIVTEAWEYTAPAYAHLLALLIWALILESARRTGGWPIFVVVLVISTYPIYADQMPGIISGLATDVRSTAALHIFGEESLLGIAMRAFALLVFGFLLFGVALQFTGGGAFFMQLAFALLGHYRGGPAKVAIFSSGLMGSMSGGPITNVLTTGTLTIPAMARIGFSRRYAAGVEACASTGGVLMPPIMGAAAFVMANFLNVGYTEIVIAAIFPALLYYFGLFMQIDAYAARQGLGGLPREELPRLGQVLKSGWYFILVFVLLTWMLVYLQRQSTAPFYATALLLAINQCTAHRLSLRKLMALITTTGALLAELAGLLAGIGLIVGALQITGVAGTLANDLVFLAGDNVLLLLIFGAATSFVLGIGMTVTAAYMFLAIILVPALIRAGLDPMASHMFVLYWGMLSYITPPVALAAFAAASLAQESPMKVALESMRLGTIIYFIPFFFVFNPALVMQGPAWEIAVVSTTATAGVVLLAAGLQGYLLGVGRIGAGWAGWLSRGCLVCAGLAFAAPGGGAMGIGVVRLAALAALLTATGVGAALLSRRRRPLAAAALAAGD
ncbi:TRAP transporter permease [Amorphus sp. MBR-141]